MNILLLLICLLQCVIADQNTCFDLNKNHEFEDTSKTVLKITGNGTMCNCEVPLYQYEFDITKIKKITIEGEITTIGKSCFANFISLETVDFGNKNTLKTIGEYSFYYCKIKEITIPSSVVEIRKNAFANCKELTSISFNTDSNLKSLGNNVFTNCNKLTSFKIPRYLETFNRDLFARCKQFNEITVDSENQYFSVEENAVYNKNKTKLIYYQNTKNKNYLKIIEGVETIEKYAISNTQLETIELPESLKIIREGAFYGNRYLKHITIPKNVELIERNAFAFNEGLVDVVVLSNNIKMKSKVMSGCNNLQSVTFSGDKIEISNDVFDECNKLSNVKVLSDFEGNVIGGKETNKNIIIGECGFDCQYIYDKSTGIMAIRGTGHLNEFKGLTEQENETIVNDCRGYCFYANHDFGRGSKHNLRREGPR